MKKNTIKQTRKCDSHKILGRKYDSTRVLINNIPYALMTLSGASVFFLNGMVALGSLYLLYGIIGAFWIIVFLCPHCVLFGSDSCPCGYGKMSSKLAEKKDTKAFRRKFSLHIPVIVPLWLIPPAGAYFLFPGGPSTITIIVLAFFILDGFLFIPIVSKIYGCSNCPIKEDCPWMKGKKKRL